MLALASGGLLIAGHLTLIPVHFWFHRHVFMRSSPRSLMQQGREDIERDLSADDTSGSRTPPPDAGRTVTSSTSRREPRPRR